DHGAILVVPIVHELEAVGVLVVERSGPSGELRPDEERLCHLIADAAALALKSAQRSERLLDLQQRHSRILRALSHEVRVPLQLMVGQLQFASERSDELDDEELRCLVRNVEKAASEFSGHIDDLLRQSLTIADRERRQMAKVDLRALLEHSVESARRLAASSALELSLDLAPEVGEIYADPEKLQRMLHHVLLGAMKLAHSGSIRVSAAVVARGEPLRERLLDLSVEDVGSGEAEPAVTARESEAPDAGLAAGLAPLVEMLDGRMHFDRGPAGHAAFRIVVPVESVAHTET
ncbi:MAG: sensor histidine kinase, partial [Candidatus Binatia bacterium]